eukprot:403368261
MQMQANLKIILIFFILASYFPHISHQQYCFAGNFPKLIGGTVDDVRLTAIALDKNKNIAVGGYTTDTSIAPNSSPGDSSVIIQSIDNLGNFRFMKVIDEFLQVLGIQYTTDNSEIFVLMDISAPNTFVVLDSLNGSFKRQYLLAAGPVKISPSFVIDTDKQVYTAFVRVEGMLKILSFNGDGVSSGTYVQRYENNVSPDSMINEIEIFENPIQKQIIMAGYFSNSAGNKFNTLLNFRPSSNLQLNKHFGIDLAKYGASHFEIVNVRSAYNSDASTPHPFINFGCIKLRSSNIMFMRFAYAADFTIGSSYFFLTGQPLELLECRGIYAKDHNVMYSYVFVNQFNQFRFMKIDFTQLPTSVSLIYQTLTPLNGGSNILTSSVFFNEKNSYYIADILNVNFVNKAYSKYTGAIMSYYNGQSCVPHSLVDQTGNLTYLGYQIEVLSVTDFWPSTSGLTYYGTNPQSLNDFTVSASYNNWCTTNIPMTYQFLDWTYYEYELYSGPKFFPYRKFFTSPYCEDATFNNIPTVYYTQLNTSSPLGPLLNASLPTSVTFDFTTNLIRVDSSDQNEVMIYFFGIRSELTQQSNYLMDQITYIAFKNPCLVATITPSVLTTQNYYFRMQNGTQILALPNFIYNNSVCEKVYEIENSTMGGTVDPLILYDNTTNVYQLSIDTNQVSVGTTFNLIFKSYYLHSNHTQTMKTIDIEITIYNCMDAQLIPPVQGNKIYNISDPTEIVPLSTFTITPNYDCGQYLYYPALILPGPIEIAMPSFIQFDSINNNLEVQTGNVLLIGTYIIRIYGNATDYSLINYYEFTLEIKCMVRSLTVSSIPIQIYGIQSPQTSFVYDEFIKTPDCPQAIAYTAFESGKSSLPSIMTFNALQRKFSVFSNDNSFAKKYDLVVRGTVTNPTSPSIYTYYDDLNIVLTVVSTSFQSTNSGPPTFTVPLVDQITVVNKFSTYNLPSVTDPDGDKFLISVQLGQQSIWIAYNQPTFKISPGLSNNGTYSIKIIISDTNKNPMSSTYFLNIKVMTEDEASSFNYSLQNGSNPSVIKSGFSPTLAAKLYSFDHKGYLTIEFTTEILVPANISTIDNNVLRLKIKPQSQSQIEDLTFQWEIISLESRQMVLYLNFTNPDLISTKGTDILQLIFMQNGRFIEQSSNKPIASEFTLIIRIPKQQEPSDANAALKSALNSASTSMKTIMVGNLALNIVMQTIQCHLFLQVGFTVIFVGNDQCHLDNFSFTIIQYKLPRKCQDALCFDYISVSI